MRKPFFACFIVILVLTVEGCYHSRLTVEGTPATEYEKKTTHALFWGLVQQDATATNCKGAGLQEVRVSTNFGYALLTVATLGIWVPLEIEWRCAKGVAPDSSAFGQKFGQKSGQNNLIAR